MLNIYWFSRTSIITKFCENAAFFNTKFRAMHDAPCYKIKYSRAIKSTTYCRKMSKNTFLAIIDYLLLQSNLIWLTYFNREENLSNINLLFKLVVLQFVQNLVFKSERVVLLEPWRIFWGNDSEQKNRFLKLDKLRCRFNLFRARHDTATHITLDRST